MKKLLIIVSLIFLASCKSDDDGNNRCNFLQNIGVNRTISLNLPQYSQLEFATNSVLIANEGNGGVYVINVGGNFRAFDAADPSHNPDSCSFLSKDGTLVTCGCQDANTYNLLTGLSEGTQTQCALKEYRVSVNGSDLTITN